MCVYVFFFWLRIESNGWRYGLCQSRIWNNLRSNIQLERFFRSKTWKHPSYKKENTTPQSIAAIAKSFVLDATVQHQSFFEFALINSRVLLLTLICKSSLSFPFGLLAHVLPLLICGNLFASREKQSNTDKANNSAVKSSLGLVHLFDSISEIVGLFMVCGLTMNLVFFGG